MYLVDTSAWLNRADNRVGGRLIELAEAGLLGVAPVTRLEALFGAQGRLWAERSAHFESLRPVTHPRDVFESALALQSDLADAGLQGRKVIDLLLAVTALARDRTVLHYDADFEMIAAVRPPFRHEWVVPRGTM